MELLSVKIIVLALMGVGRILCGMLPLAIVKLISGRWSKSADRRLKKCISVLVFFGGGVMLATCFLHMMPEVQESFNEALPEVHVPIAQIIFVLGFFLVYIMEDIVHALIHKRKRKKRERKNKKAAEAVVVPNSLAIPYKNGGSTNNNDSPADPARIAVIGKNTDYNLNGGLCYANNYSQDHYRKQHLTSSSGEEHGVKETRELFKKNIVRKCDDIPGLPGKDRAISTTNIQTKNHENLNTPQAAGTTGNGRSTGLIVGVEKFSYIYGLGSQANGLGNSDNNAKALHDLQLTKSKTLNDYTPNDDTNSSSSDSTSCSRKNLAGSEPHNHHHHQDEDDDDDEDHYHHHHEHSHIPIQFIDGENELDQSIGNEIRNMLIIIAISFHGIFEGLAIGLQDTAEDVWYMFFAVSLHECTILFCIGIELISNKTKVLRMVLYVLIVSLVSPVGIAIGIVITEKEFGAGGAQALVVGSFQGLAAGSLLYVTFFEIFQEEGRKLNRKYIHILVALLGFILMGCLEFLGGHSHGKSRGHSHGGNVLEGHELSSNRTWNGTLQNNDQLDHDHDDHHDHHHDHEH